MADFVALVGLAWIQNSPKIWRMSQTQVCRKLVIIPTIWVPSNLMVSHRLFHSTGYCHGYLTISGKNKHMLLPIVEETHQLLQVATSMDQSYQSNMSCDALHRTKQNNK
jgi:hypothetical protein